MKAKETKSEEHSLLKVTHLADLQIRAKHKSSEYFSCAACSIVLLTVTDMIDLLIRAKLLVVDIPQHGKNSHTSEIHYFRFLSANVLL